MPIFYTCLENQLRDNGTFGLLYDHFSELNPALAKFYTVCAAAAVSEIPYHAAAVWTSDGRIIKQEIFDRRIPEPEPEPEPEEEIPEEE